MRVAKFGALLTGTLLKQSKKKQVAGVISMVSTGASRNLRNPYVIDFDTEVLPGITSYPINLKESTKLAEKAGEDTDMWIGYGLVIAATEPSGGFPAGLTIIGVATPEQVSKTRKTSPRKKPTSAKEQPVPDVDWNDVTF